MKKNGVGNFEWKYLRTQIVTSKKGRGGRRYNPNVFREQGVSMLSSVLKSERAINVNIAIMRTFVKMRMLLDENVELKFKIEAMEERYDEQFDAVFEAIKKLIGKKNKKRNPIGYKTEK